MQQPPPANLYQPIPYEEHPDDGATGMLYLIVATVIVTLASFLVLNMIHGDHAYHGDRALTPEMADCLSDQMDEFVRTGVPTDSNDCKPVMPWYAAHPIWYGIAIGAVVLVIGRGYLFMRRMEANNGR